MKTYTDYIERERSGWIAVTGPAKAAKGAELVLKLEAMKRMVTEDEAKAMLTSTEAGQVRALVERVIAETRTMLHH